MDYFLKMDKKAAILKVFLNISAGYLIILVIMKNNQFYTMYHGFDFWDQNCEKLAQITRHGVTTHSLG